MLPARQQQQRRPGGGWDRCRISERLQAALAGLQELQVLRERQRALVSGALAMQPPAAGSPAQSKEQRLEATLAALKEQLVSPRACRCKAVPKAGRLAAPERGRDGEGLALPELPAPACLAPVPSWPSPPRYSVRSLRFPFLESRD